jgi:hypothetical protein
LIGCRNRRGPALIARIDNSAPIPIGGERSLVAPATGRLYLGVNDDHLADNAGSFTAHIAVMNR